jgi:hypothetical protein
LALATLHKIIESSGTHVRGSNILPGGDSSEQQVGAPAAVQSLVQVAVQALAKAEDELLLLLLLLLISEWSVQSALLRSWCCHCCCCCYLQASAKAEDELLLLCKQSLQTA